jgi:hypothetical protein
MSYGDWEPEEKITEVEDHETHPRVLLGCMSIPLRKELMGSKPTPKVGDMISFKRRDYNSTLGVKVNGEVLYERTIHDLALEDEEQKLRFALDHIEAFKKAKPALDAAYESLPSWFKMRINKFRGNNPKFRWEYESYEMFCCTQAVKIAEAFKGKPKDIFDVFVKAEWADQLKMVPGLEDGHSGNTFGAACQLAYHSLTKPENVTRMHGALAPLVGSEEYGCVASKQPEAE